MFGGIAAAIVGKDWFADHARYSRNHCDIDLVGRKEDLHILRRILAGRGYKEAKRVALETEGGRALFGRDGYAVDFAGDELSFCQRINIRSRLTLSYPTLSYSDLILEKVQIAAPPASKIMDFIAILCSVSPENLERPYLENILGRNWEFWHSASEFIRQATIVARAEGLADVKPRLADLAIFLDRLPKSIPWRLRAIFGTSISWHSPVESLDTHEKQV
jgi:hypothetical protein